MVRSRRTPAICKPCTPSYSTCSGVSQMTTCWFSLISWPVKPVCKFSSLFGNYAKGRGKMRQVGKLTWLLLMIVATWLLFSDAPTCPSSGSPPCQFLETFKSFLPNIRKGQGDLSPSGGFPCKMQRGLEKADYINLAPGQTWGGEISIIWHWPQLVTHCLTQNSKCQCQFPKIFTAQPKYESQILSPSWSPRILSPKRR